MKFWLRDVLREDEPEPPAVVVVTPTPVIPESDEDIDLVAEQVEFGHIAAERRHEETMEGISECRTRLENFSTAESPLLNQIATEVSEIKTRLDHLTSQSLTSSNLPPSELIPTEEPMNRDEPVTVVSMEEPAPVAPSPRPKKYRRI